MPDVKAAYEALAAIDDDDYLVARWLLIDPTDRDPYMTEHVDVTPERVEELRAHAVTMTDDTDDWDRREKLTLLALSWSLCPLHVRDYAICFDDQDAECAAIRTIHPIHDT